MGVKRASQVEKGHRTRYHFRDLYLIVLDDNNKVRMNPLKNVNSMPPNELVQLPHHSFSKVHPTHVNVLCKPNGQKR